MALALLLRPMGTAVGFIDDLCRDGGVVPPLVVPPVIGVAFGDPEEPEEGPSSPS